MRGVACAETTCHRVAMVTTANSARQLRFSDLCDGQEPEFEHSCNYVDAWVERLCDRLAGIAEPGCAFQTIVLFAYFT
eukprot:COSAG01_NODE_5874_length_3978_cov_2.018041_3_plen_78_part_00